MQTSARTRAADYLSGQSILSQALRYLMVGTSGMVLYLGAYAALALAMSATLANVGAWLLSTLVCNSAHRRVTFGVRDHQSGRADAAIGMAASLLGLALSTVAVGLAASASEPIQILALLGGSSIGGASRFLLMRWWLGHTHGTVPVAVA